MDNPLALADERLMLLHITCFLDAADPASSVFCRRSWVRFDWAVPGLALCLRFMISFYESIVMPFMYPTIPFASRYPFVEPFIICALAPCLHPLLLSPHILQSEIVFYIVTL